MPYNPLQTNIVDLLLKRVKESPEKLAYTFSEDGETENSSLTYQQLGQQACSIAAFLQSITTPGERVLLLYPPGLEFITAFLGCLCAQVVAVPAYPPRRNRNLDRIVAIARDAQPSLILTMPSMVDQIRSQLQSLDLGNICCLAVPSRLAARATDWQPGLTTSEALAFLQYTSGSTGNPKGVMVSHGNITHNLAMIKCSFQPDKTSIVLGWLPLFHDMGLIGNVLQPLYSGIPCHLMPPTAFLQKPIRWLQAISQYRATISGGPNFAYDLCISRISAEQKATLDLSCWMVAFNGAEPIRAKTLQRFTEAFADCGFRPEAFYPCYGMAETTLLVSGGMPGHKPVLKHVETSALTRNQIVPLEAAQTGGQTLVGCGSTILEQDIVIVDPESLEEKLTDQVGEIWVTGNNVAQGYWQNLAKTQETFAAYLANTRKEPFLRTGDLGFLDSNKELFVTGRLKELIIICGRNYYPQDIEKAVQHSHPALRLNGGAAFAVKERGREQLIIIHEVERHYLRRLNVAEVVNSMREAVANEFGLPVDSVVLLRTNSLLKTSSGKIQRLSCRTAFLNNTLNEVGRNDLDSDAEDTLRALYIAPCTPLERQLTAVLEELLDFHPISTHDNFFELGVHSLLAAQLLAEIEEKFGVALPPATLFIYPTVEQLARLINRPPSADQPWESLIPIKEGKEKIPLFLIHDADGEVMLYLDLARRLHPDRPVYAIRPYGKEGFPILHTRLTDIITHYLEQIRSVQPEGPYCLGGLCLGGNLAFMLGQALQNQGQTVNLVALIDAPAPGVAIRAEQKESTKIDGSHKLLLYKFVRDCELPIPSVLHDTISVRMMFRFIGYRYINQCKKFGKQRFRGRLILFRANDGSGEETPVRQKTLAPFFGWEDWATEGVGAYDIPGTHSSILQEPHVQILANRIEQCIEGDSDNCYES